MQALFPFRPVIDLVSIRECLVARFGHIRVADQPDPVSQFVGFFISSRAYGWKSWDTFVWLVRRYPSFDAVADIDIEATLEGAALSEKKAPELNLALRAIRAYFGQINLDFLKHCSVNQVLSCIGK